MAAHVVRQSDLVNVDEVTHETESELLQFLRRGRTNAPERPNRQRGEPRGLSSGINPNDATTGANTPGINDGFRLLRGQFCEELVTTHADATLKKQLITKTRANLVGNLQRSPAQCMQTPNVEEHFIEADRFEVRRNVIDNRVKLGGIGLVSIEATGQHNQ